MTAFVFVAAVILAATVCGCVLERLVPHIGAGLFPVDEVPARSGPAELAVRAELTADTLAYLRDVEAQR